MSLATYKKFENTEFKKEYLKYSKTAEKILNAYREENKEKAFDCFLENVDTIEDLFDSNKKFYKFLRTEKSFINFIQKLHSYDRSITFDIKNACFEVNETTEENKENKDFIQNHFIIATIK